MFLTELASGNDRTRSAVNPCIAPVANAGISVGVVNAFGAGATAAEELLKAGISLTHIQTAPDDQLDGDYLRSFRKFPQGTFANKLVYDPQLSHAENIATLKNGIPGVSAVLGLSESGVTLGHDMAHSLGLPTDDADPRLAKARRNKVTFGKVLRDAKLRTAIEFASGDPAAILTWIHRNLFNETQDEWTKRDPKAKWPNGKFVLVKPPAGAGGEGVRPCYSDWEVLTHFEALFRKHNHTGEFNDEVLVQLPVSGSEYVLDLFYWNGLVIVVDVWRYEKFLLPATDDELGAVVYGRDILLPYHGPAQDRIIPYGLKVGAAVGKRFGPVHMEVFDDETDPLGPVAIDFGNRYQGGKGQKLLKKALGRNQFDLTVDTIRNPHNPELFLREYRRQQAGLGYDMKMHGLVVNLVSLSKGIFPAPEQYLPTLKEYDSIQWDTAEFYDKDKPYPRTAKLSDSPGEFGMLHADPAILEQQYNAIREHEKAGLFRK